MRWKRKVALVTGGAGLVGSRVVKDLVKRGAEVKVLDNVSGYPFDQLAHFGIKSMDGVQFEKGDVLDPSAVERAIRGADVVFHEAAFADVAATIWNPREDFDSNCCGTFRVLEAVRNNDIERFIFASSASIYGDSKNGRTSRFSESLKPDPISTYGNSKLWGESESLLFHKLYGVKTTALRYFS